MNVTPEPNIAPQTHRRRGGPKGLNPKPILAELAVGMSVREVAEKHGVNKTSINRIRQKYGDIKSTVAEFVKNRADILAENQELGLQISKMVLKSMGTEDAINALDPRQRIALLTAANTGVGILYDKERLERGQSTANVQSLLHVAQQRADAECCGTRRVDTDRAEGDTG